MRRSERGPADSPGVRVSIPAAAAAAVLMILFAAFPAGARTQQESGAAHPPPESGGTADAAGTEKVTTRILCPCGTCVNQTLHVCTCGTAAGERARIAEALSAGRTAESIIEDYIDRYGVQILTTPEKVGFNLLGWLVPFIASAVALVTLTVILRGWTKAAAVSAPAAAAAATAAGLDPADSSYRERIERELEEFKS